MRQSAFCEAVLVAAMTSMFNACGFFVRLSWWVPEEICNMGFL